MTSPFGFYEIVVVADSERSQRLGIANKEAVILGISEPEEAGQEWGYAVQPLDEQVGYAVAASELRPTGRYELEEKFRSALTLRVSPKGEPLGYIESDRDL